MIINFIDVHQNSSQFPVIGWKLIAVFRFNCSNAAILISNDGPDMGSCRYLIGIRNISNRILKISLIRIMCVFQI